MPRRYTQRPWDATTVIPGEPIYLIPTGNRTRFYPVETLPVVARVVDVKRVYAYLELNPHDRERIKMRLSDGVVVDDETNSGWLTFRTRKAYDDEMRRRTRLDRIYETVTANGLDDLPANAIDKIYRALLDEDAIEIS